MTDWLRVLGLSLLSVLAILAGWFLRSQRQLRKFRLSDKTITSIQDSQRGRRPMWTVDASDVTVHKYEHGKDQDR